MNIIIYTFPFRGHSMQAISIANYLLKKGNRVTVDTHPEFFQYLLPDIKKKECLYRFFNFSEGLHREKLLNWAEGVFVITKEYDLNFNEQVDLIIYDSMAYWGKHLAEKHKIMSVSLMTIQPFTREQFHQSVYKSFLKNYIVESDSYQGFWRRIHIYQVITKKKFGLMDDFSFDDFLCARGEKNIVLLPKSLCKYAIQLDDDYVGFSPIINGSINKVQNQGSIFVATGSMICDMELLSCCIESLLPYNRTIHVSSGKYTSKLRNQYCAYSNVHFYEFAPQTELLKQAAVFITHGGSNSICEAIATRTPMIVIPIVNDEYLNAEMVVEAGIGVQIESDTNIIRDTLGDAYEMITMNGSYIEHINTIAKEIDPNKVWAIIDEISGDSK